MLIRENKFYVENIVINNNKIISPEYSIYRLVRNGGDALIGFESAANVNKIDTQSFRLKMIQICYKTIN